MNDMTKQKEMKRQQLDGKIIHEFLQKRNYSNNVEDYALLQEKLKKSLSD